MKCQKKRTIWITRDIDALCYEIWSDKPSWKDGMWFSEEDRFGPGGLCAQGFEAATGWKLKGGPKSIIELELS